MRRLLGGLVVLALLLVGADRGGAWLSGRLVARRVQSSQTLATRPDVDVTGVPFLTQLAAGDYRDVEVRVEGLARGSLQVQRLTVHLQGVRVPPGQLIRRSVDAVPVRRVDGSALLTYAALIRALDGRVQVSSAGGGRVRVSTAVTVAGVRLSGSATGAVALRRGYLVVTARDVRVGSGPAGAAAVAALGPALSFRLRLPDLPFGVRLTGVRAGADGVVVSVRADGVVLRG